MSDLHTLAQEILEDCEANINRPLAGIINYHTQNCTEAEKELVIEAFGELLREKLLG